MKVSPCKASSMTLFNLYKKQNVLVLQGVMCGILRIIQTRYIINSRHQHQESERVYSFNHNLLLTIICSITNNVRRLSFKKLQTSHTHTGAEQYSISRFAFVHLNKCMGLCVSGIYVSVCVCSCQCVHVDGIPVVTAPLLL